MAGRVRSWPVRAVPAGTLQEVALSRQVAAVTVRAEVRGVLVESQAGSGWSQPSLFVVPDGWAGRAA